MENSDLIYTEFENCSTELDRIEKENKKANEILEIIKKIEKLIETKDLNGIDEIIKKINEIKTDKELKNNIKKFMTLFKIAIKINNRFEQYNEYLEKILEAKKLYQNIIKNNKLECEKLKSKINVLEYVNMITLPIDEETKIKDIINKCKSKSVDTIEILKIIMNQNINLYNSEKEQPKKEEYLTLEKMNELGIDEEMQELILEIKDLTNNIKKDGTDGMVNYLLTITDEEELDKTLDKHLFVCDETFILGILKNLLDKINNGSDVLELLSSIYFKYLERKNNNETSNGEKSKLIFLVKPTSNTPYIYDDIEKIESEALRQRLKRQFLELVNGNTSGKPLTMAGMFEKKRFKVRITFTMLPNNHILIISCYQKGINGMVKTKERLNPSATAQIMLYKALINKDKQEIQKAITYITKSLKISQGEIDNYISNFNTSQDIDILDYFEKDLVEKQLDDGLKMQKNKKIY